MIGCEHIEKKRYADGSSVQTGGSGNIFIGDVKFDKGVEVVVIRNFYLIRDRVKEQRKVFFVGAKCPVEKFQNKTMFLDSDFNWVPAQKVKRCVVTPSGKVYALGKKEIVINPELIVDGKFINGDLFGVENEF